ncbi:hypothetical protein Tco_0216647 [Tanacetum coccineum]
MCDLKELIRLNRVHDGIKVEQVVGMRQDAQKIPGAAELYSNANVILGAQYIHLRIQLDKRSRKRYKHLVSACAISVERSLEADYFGIVSPPSCHHESEVEPLL